MSILTLQDSPQPIVSPQALEARRQIAMAMLKEGGNYSPIQSPWQGVARVADAFMGGLAARRLEQQELAGRQAVANDIGNAIQGAFGGGSSAFPPAPTSSAADASQTPTTNVAGGSSGSAPDMSGNDIYSGFMDTIKGGITNPNALAAVAATGKAESAYDPSRAYGSWSDPSQSGQAGTSGGIMSWRGPRLQAMREYVAANGGDPNKPSPQLQAQFFLQEDPNLISALNSAKTPGQAQQLMNNAWKFAGYDQPGGEAARRIALANNFASQFTGPPALAAANAVAGGQLPQNAPVPQPNPVQVASLDPSAGIAATGPLATVPPEFASKGITQDQWNAMNAPDGATAGNAQAFAPTPAQAPIPTPSPNGPGSDLYVPPSLPAPYDSIRQAIPAPSQADISAAVSRVASGAPQQFPPEFSPQDISAANGGLPQSAPITQQPPLAGGPNGATPISPLGQQLLMNPHALSGDGSVLPPSASAPTGKDAVVAAMNAPAAASPARSNLPVMAGGSSDAVNPSLGAVGGRGGMDPGAIAKIVNAMSSPWASEGQQQILGSVLSSRLTPHKIEMVPLGNGDTAEVDSITGQQVGLIHGVKPPIAMGYDQVLRDPNTGKIVGGGMDNGQLPYRFMTQQEKQANGLPLDTPIQVGPDGKMVSNGVTVNTGTPQSQYSDEMAKGLSGPHMALESGVEQAQEQLRDIHAMQAAVQQLQQNGGTTGMGQPEIMKLQSAINTGANLLGVDQPFDISDKEFLSKFNRQIAGAQAKSAAGARVTNFELKNYLQANPGLEMSPQGNERLLGIQSQVLQRNVDVGQAIRSATAEAVSQGRKVNPAQIEQIIRDYDSQHHITDPITGQDLTKDVKLKDLQPPAASGAGQIATPKTQADFDALPSGAIYTDPEDGKQYRKP